MIFINISSLRLSPSFPSSPKPQPELSPLSKPLGEARSSQEREKQEGEKEDDGEKGETEDDGVCASPP